MPSPWIFRRDELDALEDQLDEVFDLHEQSRNQVQRSLEEGVISEQSRTEDLYEKRLADLLGPESLGDGGNEGDDGHACENCQGTGLPEGVPLRDLLGQRRDVIYVRAYAWSTKVFLWARDCYWEQGMRNRDMFRVNVNTYLVPVKIAFALVEEARGDEHSPAIASMEYELASTYLSRVRESLGSLRAMGMSHPEMGWMMDEADGIAVALDARRKNLKI